MGSIQSEVQLKQMGTEAEEEEMKLNRQFPLFLHPQWDRVKVETVSEMESLHPAIKIKMEGGGLRVKVADRASYATHCTCRESCFLSGWGETTQRETETANLFALFHGKVDRFWNDNTQSLSPCLG